MIMKNEIAGNFHSRKLNVLNVMCRRYRATRTNPLIVWWSVTQNVSLLRVCPLYDHCNVSLSQSAISDAQSRHSNTLTHLHAWTGHWTRVELLSHMKKIYSKLRIFCFFLQPACGSVFSVPIGRSRYSHMASSHLRIHCTVLILIPVACWVDSKIMNTRRRTKGKRRKCAYSGITQQSMK